MRILPLLICACTVLTSCAIPIQAMTLSFEDLKPACDTVSADPYTYLIPNGYGGLNWDHFFALDAPAYSIYRNHPTNGYLNGTVSGSVVIFNGDGIQAMMLEADAPIAMHSAYLTGVWNDALIVKADGYLGDVLKYTKTVTLSAYHPTLISYEFIGVDKIVWKSSGGTYAGFGGSGKHFAMDDLNYDFVPEPSSVLALLCGISGVGYIASRR